ncbi:MAG: SufD family Fe-S cluster assembly protein [Lachnospiraceae bacterium]|nr:SufD family Fe-S cluster assembly protein [Lachnospiraceae bacterium]
MGLDMTINRLPGPTWHWLHVNEASLRGVSAPLEGRLETETPDTIRYYKEETLRDFPGRENPCDLSMDAVEKNAAKEEAGIGAAALPTAAIDVTALAQIPTGLGEDMDALASKSDAGFHFWEIAPGVKESAPVRLHFSYAGGETVQNRIGIYAGEDSEITVIMDFRGMAQKEDIIAEKVDLTRSVASACKRADDYGFSKSSVLSQSDEANAQRMGKVCETDSSGAGFAAVQTKICAGKGAKVRLVQIQKLSDDFTFLNDVGATCGEGAVIESIQIVLGGGETYMGMRTELGAKSSRLESKIGYLLDQKETLDMNYIAYHTGAKTTSHMDVSGVLRGEAKKLFRGTIDFRNGSVGAKGDEKEDVLLFSEGVVNRTVPLILCEEEDVEGNHGATIGRLDEALMFYLSSRGIEEKDIYEMMARARIDALCRDIPDPKTQELVQAYLGETDTSR